MNKPMNRFAKYLGNNISTTINRGANEQSRTHRKSFQRFTLNQPVINETNPAALWQEFYACPPSGGEEELDFIPSPSLRASIPPKGKSRRAGNYDVKWRKAPWRQRRSYRTGKELEGEE